jgi:hypothetical protein
MDEREAEKAFWLADDQAAYLAIGDSVVGVESSKQNGAPDAGRCGSAQIS